MSQPRTERKEVVQDAGKLRESRVYRVVLTMTWFMQVKDSCKFGAVFRILRPHSNPVNLTSGLLYSWIFAPSESRVAFLLCIDCLFEVAQKQPLDFLRYTFLMPIVQGLRIHVELCRVDYSIIMRRE